MVKSFKIGKKCIGENEPVFLIAEAGVNHNGDIELAKQLVDIAVDAEVDAVKFQTFNADELILKSTPKVEYQIENRSDNETFYDLLKKLTLSHEDFRELKSYCEERQIIFLSTPFDKSSIDFLEDLEISAYKIGSGDMNNFPFLERICSKGKPILLSTGMANLEEVKESVSFIKSNNIKNLVIFQCTTNYPADLEELNLNVLDTYYKEFPNSHIGFSDHSLGYEASIGAVAKGAKVIEKHVTIDKEMKGPDHKASLDPKELNQWVKKIRNIEKALGISEKLPSQNEIEIAQIARKSLVSSRNLKEGSIIKKEDIVIKRPGNGIPPKYFNKIIGRIVSKDITKNMLINWEDLL